MDDLKADVLKYREMLSRFESMKVNIYIENLFNPRLNDDEDTQLEIDMSMKTNLDPFVSYLLSKVNLTIISSSQFDIQLKEKGLVSLKDKLINVLQAMESEEVRTENIGLLLYIASRLYLVQDSKRTYLISYLKSPLFSQTNTWELYFIQRVNRGLSQTQRSSKTTLQKTLGILKSPFELIGIGKSEEQTPEKEARNRKEFHPAVLMEIAQHLVQLNVGPDDSTDILITLFKKYSIESLLMQSVFVVHQKAIAGQFEDRIRQSVIEKRRYDPSQTSKMTFSIQMASSFLNPIEVLNLALVSKGFFKHIRRLGWLESLRDQHLTNHSRSVILKKATIDHNSKCLQFENLLPIDQCHLTAEQSRLIEFDVKRTSRNPVILDVPCCKAAIEKSPLQYSNSLFGFDRVPSRHELHGSLPHKSVLD